MSGVARANDRGYLRFEVQDTGVGVSGREAPGNLQRIRPGRFQPCAPLRRLGAGACHFQAAGRGHGRGDRHRSRRPAAAASSGSPSPSVVVRPADESEGEKLAGCTVAIVTRNAVMREALTAQIRNAGGEVRPLGQRARRRERDQRARRAADRCRDGDEPDCRPRRIRASCRSFWSPPARAAICRSSSARASPAIWSSRCGKPPWSSASRRRRAPAMEIEGSAEIRPAATTAPASRHRWPRRCAVASPAAVASRSSWPKTTPSMPC